MANVDPALSNAGLNGAKRKADESPQPRAKRNRYISIACNECKRRKIKCNGETPCQRCGNLRLDCVYAPNCCGTNFRDTDEFRQMSAHIASLQHQVDTLFANLSTLRSELGQSNLTLDPSLQGHAYDNTRAHVQARQDAGMPVFHGPTSNAYSLDVAKSSLQTMGISADEPDTNAEASPPRSPGLEKVELRVSEEKDPIWSVSREDAIRLLDVYEEEMHEMYPVISMRTMRVHTNTLYRFIHAMLKARMTRLDKPGSDAIYDDDTNLLKVALAIALTVEGNGRSDLGRRLFQSVQPQVDALLLGNPGIKGIRLLVLTANYNFHSDNEGTAWRIIGLTARLCIELGLHRKEAYDKMSTEDRESAILLFWSVYTLDRRWSFGTGMPFALQESDLDPDLPRPGQSSPFLTAIIEHCSISARIWRAVGFEKGGVGSQDIPQEDIRYLDYQMRRWHSGLPEQYHFDRDSLDKLNLAAIKPVSLRLRLVPYLRRNSCLTLLHRPVLYSVASITKNPIQAQEVVDIAKETITVIAGINEACGLYKTSQVLFNPYLTMSLAVLFLAVSHAPAKFADQVRDEVNLALDLVRGFSRDSFVAKRLWKTIKVLKQAAPKLGLMRNGDQRAGHQPAAANGNEHGVVAMNVTPPREEDDPSRTAALAMAGLAGHNVDQFALFGGGGASDQQQQHQHQQQQYQPQAADLWSQGSSAVSPDLMAHDLNSLFEAAEAFSGGFGVNGGVAGADGDAVGHDAGAPFDTFAGAVGGAVAAGVDGNAALSGHGLDGTVFGDEDELSRIMRDLF